MKRARRVLGTLAVVLAVQGVLAPPSYARHSAGDWVGTTSQGGEIHMRINRYHYIPHMVMDIAYKCEDGRSGWTSWGVTYQLFLHIFNGYAETGYHSSGLQFQWWGYFANERAHGTFIERWVTIYGHRGCHTGLISWTAHHVDLPH
jgi:hypothetical protein